MGFRVSEGVYKRNGQSEIATPLRRALDAEHVAARWLTRTTKIEFAKLTERRRRRSFELREGM